jgi:hypothetical protein
MNERTASGPAPNDAPEDPTVFEQGLGMFSSPEDAALIDEVISFAYTERQRPAKEQPLAPDGTLSPPARPTVTNASDRCKFLPVEIP